MARSNRAVAKHVLVQLASRQEEWRLRTRAYAADFEPLNGTAADHFYISRDGSVQTAPSANAVYRIAFVDAPAATEFALEAVAVEGQLADTGCTRFALTSAGRRSAHDASGTPAPRCW